MQANPGVTLGVTPLPGSKGGAYLRLVAGESTNVGIINGRRDTRTQEAMVTTETVYLETSVISYLAARPSRDLLVAGQQQVTWEWWDKERHLYRLFISQTVVREASLGDPGVAKRRLAFLEGFELLGLDEGAYQLADDLIARQAVPEKARADALHIAVAAVNGVDYVLTWNCKHINNAHTRKLINSVCTDAGYDPPVLCTPQEIMEEA